jgi:hypothetical protein
MCITANKREFLATADSCVISSLTAAAPTLAAINFQFVQQRQNLICRVVWSQRPYSALVTAGYRWVL